MAVFGKDYSFPQKTKACAQFYFSAIIAPKYSLYHLY